MQARRASWIAMAMACCCLGDASAEAMRCDSCRPAAMRAAARDAGVGTHHVYSLTSDAIRSYRVAMSNGIAEASSVPTPADIALCVSGLREIHIASNGTMKVTIRVPYESLGMKSVDGDGTSNPANVATLRDVLLPARLASDNIPSASAGVNALLVYARTLTGLREGIEITWDVTFSNRAMLTYYQTLGDAHPRLRLQKANQAPTQRE